MVLFFLLLQRSSFLPRTTAMQATTTGHYKNPTSVYESVKNYYGRVLHTSKDLKTSACCTAKRPHKTIRDALAR